MIVRSVGAGEGMIERSERSDVVRCRIHSLHSLHQQQPPNRHLCYNSNAESARVQGLDSHFTLARASAASPRHRPPPPPHTKCGSDACQGLPNRVYTVLTLFDTVLYLYGHCIVSVSCIHYLPLY